MRGVQDCGIKVICRFRPVNEKEKREAARLSASADVTITEYLSEDSVKIKRPGKDEKTFVFDRVFQPECLQTEVFDFTAKSLVEDVLNGFNGTIFAYGQTGSGKSWTMFGERKDPVLVGIIPRAADKIFSHILQDRSGSVYSIRVSFLEIYNENIRDLLDRRNQNLAVRQSPARGIYVEGATECPIDSEGRIFQLLRAGEQVRSTFSTDMNQHSSRSHSLFIVMIERKDPDGTTSTGKLNLVDLAGSEKVGKTGATGDRLQEAKKINLSLSALGNVINALTDDKKPHIPYRDSKLTRILQESLGGNCKTSLIITCSPHVYNIEETFSTCLFGQRAKHIQNQVKQNKQKSVAELLRINKRLQEQLHAWKMYAGELREIVGWYQENGAAASACPFVLPEKPSLSLPKKSSGILGPLGRDGRPSTAQIPRNPRGFVRPSESSTPKPPRAQRRPSRGPLELCTPGRDNLAKSHSELLSPRSAAVARCVTPFLDDDSKILADDGTIDPEVLLLSVLDELENAEMQRRIIVDDYEENIRDLKGVLEEKEEAIKALQERLAESGDSSATLEEYQRVWQDEKATIQFELQEKEFDAELAREEIEKLYGDVAALKSELADYADKKKELKRVAQEKQKLAKELKMARRSLGDAQASAQELQDKLDAATKTHSTQAAALESRAEDAEAREKALSTEQTKSKKLVRALRLKLKSKIDLLKETQQTLAQRDTRAAELEARVAELGESMAKMQELRDQALSGCASLSADAARAIDAQNELERVRATLKSVESRGAFLEKRLREVEENLRQSRRSEEAVSEEMEETAQKLSDVLRLVGERDRRIAALEGAAAEREQRIAALEGSARELKAAEARARAEAVESGAVAEKLAEVQRKGSRLKKKLHRVRRERKSLLRDAEEKTQRTAAMEQQLEQLRRTLQRNGEKMRAADCRSNSLKIENLKLNERVRNLERRLERTKRTLGERIADMELKMHNPFGARIAQYVTSNSLGEQRLGGF